MEHDLKLKPSKCNFFRTEISYLGHKVSAAGMELGTEGLRLLGTCLGANVMVHECPPLSPPGLPSDGHQAHMGLVTGARLFHLLHNVLQMAAPRAPFGLYLATGVGACEAAMHARPTQKFL